MSSHIEDFREDVKFGAHDDDSDVEAHGPGGFTQEDVDIGAHDDDEPDVEAHGPGSLVEDVNIS
jgi:hypothetical protein